MIDPKIRAQIEATPWANIGNWTADSLEIAIPLLVKYGFIQDAKQLMAVYDQRGCEEFDLPVNPEGKLTTHIDIIVHG